MAFKVIKESLNGLKLIQSDIFKDDRGIFLESYKKSAFHDIGICESFYQDNMSISQKNVLRGMHFQWDQPMGKLLRVVRGKARFAEVDIRIDSPTFAQYDIFELSENSGLLLWAPFGFANGFVALEDNTIVEYKCSAEYNPKGESAILWNDKNINIEWGLDNPLLSPKDENAQTLKDWLNRPESKYFKI